MHTRRSLVHGAGVTVALLLAGCSGAPPGGGSGGDTPGDDGPSTDDGTPGGDDEPPADDGTPADGTGTDTGPSDRQRPPDATRRATVVATDPAPDLPVVPRVELADRYATGGSPPVLRVDVDNPTDGPVVLGEYREVVFQYVHAADAPLLWLPHSERSTAGEPDRALPGFEVAGEGCWRLTAPVAVTEEYGTVEVPAGGTLRAFVGLYGTPEAGDCLPTGEHRFAATYTHYPSGLDGGDSQAADWGFTLGVEALDPE